MERLRVLVTRRWPEEVEHALAERFEVVLNSTDKPLSQAELAQAMGEFDILCPTVSDRIDADVITGGDRVKLIANYGVGFDHIDLKAAKAKEIAVSNTPGVLTDATADIAMTLLLMAARRAKHGFGMRIAYFGRREADADIVAELEAEYFPELHGLLAASDFVSLHIPGGAETTNLINAEALATMKPSGYLINTARGGVIDHEALAHALSVGELAGAGLDVYPHEPRVPASLLGLENVVLLPHLGSANAETRIAMGMKALANAAAFASGEPLPDRIA